MIIVRLVCAALRRVGVRRGVRAQKIEPWMSEFHR